MYLSVMLPSTAKRTDRTIKPWDQTPSESPTLNHFDEKPFLLKDRMNTDTGRKMAADRHEFMLTYLEQFHAEWNCER